MPTLLLTGANRGVGLGLATVYLNDGWDVVATARDPAAAQELHALQSEFANQLDLHPLDLTAFDSIDALKAELGDRPIDVLLGNGAKTNCPNAPLGETDYESWAEAFKVNAMAQLKLAETFTENVAASQNKTMYFISSRIGASPPAGLIVYRSSKSALNQVVLQLSMLLADRGIIVACGHPGFVKARSTGFKGVFEPLESAGHIKEVIDGLTLEGSGRFYDPDGSTLPIVTQQTNPNAVGAKPPGAWD